MYTKLFRIVFRRFFREDAADIPTEAFAVSKPTPQRIRIFFKDEPRMTRPKFAVSQNVEVQPAIADIAANLTS